MKHLKTYESENNDFFHNFIKEQDIIFKRTKEYLNTYEKGITQLQILYITSIDYYHSYGRKSCKIWFKDNRDQFNFNIDLNDEQTKRLIDYINNPELFNSLNKYNI